MKRREFTRLLVILAGWPLTVRAQQTAIPVIGSLSLNPERSAYESLKAFQSGLAALGYREGENIRVLYRFADGNANRLPTLAAELVSLGAKVIVTAGSASIQAVHDAAPNVAIVSVVGPDPVTMGWAQSYARPGGMITGLFYFGSQGKKWELLKEVRPQATTFALLLNATNPANLHSRKLADDVGRALGLKLEIVEVKEMPEVVDAIGRMASLGVEGLVINADPVFNANAVAIAELTRAHKLPSVSDDRNFVDAGGLFAFSINYPALARSSATYVDQILKGIAPGDLAMEQAREFKLFINLKTAKEFGITIPPTLLARAEEVIE